jgi:hypothetical protein
MLYAASAFALPLALTGRGSGTETGQRRFVQQRDQRM